MTNQIHPSTTTITARLRPFKWMSQPLRAVLLCLLMLMMSLSPLLISTSAENADEETRIPVDTGWIQLDLTDSDGDNISTADFHHLVPYGVQMTDISLQVQVDGTNDLFVENPRIMGLPPPN